METIGGRIRALRLARGIKQKELTAKLGWKYTRLSGFELGRRTPSIEDIQKLAVTFGCSIEEILGQNGNGNVFFPSVQIQRIPLLNWKDIGQLSIVNLETELLKADRFVSIVGQEVTAKAFALVVEGDSMTSPNGELPSFPQGTDLVVDPKRQCKSGDFVIAHDNTGNAVFKKLTTDGSSWFLKPINPIYPVVQIIDLQQIIGVVIRSQMGQDY